MLDATLTPWNVLIAVPEASEPQPDVGYRMAKHMVWWYGIAEATQKLQDPPC